MSIYIFIRPFFTQINAYIFETMIMLPLKYIYHILIYLWFSFHQVNVLFFMSYIIIILQSSHSENTLCIPSFLEVFEAPTQFHETAGPLNILVITKSLDQIKVEGSCLEVL